MTTAIDQIKNLLLDNARSGVLPSHVATMELGPETRVEELGLDSLGKMSLLTGLMDLTDKFLADDAIKESSTLADIAELIS